MDQHDEHSDKSGSIAVIGMSCRYPGANNPAEFWNLLSEGRDAIRRFPSDRPFHGPEESREMQAGFLKCPVDEFDAKFFGMSPREAELVDPQQRLLLEVTWESLEDAGINPQALRDSETGVYVGTWQNDYEKIITDPKRVAESDEASDFLHVFLGNKFSATASRISYFLGLNGPALAVESGCSSSLNALHLACEGLRAGGTSMALVSGVNLILLPFNLASGTGDSNVSVILSKDHKCKTFDESADGFVRAEGCGVVVLKRFEDAWKSGDRILAIIKGSALNNDGSGTSFGTPNEQAQERVYRAALKRAGVSAADVTFVETHGTGTFVGDPIEMYAVAQAYSENRTEPLFVGSVKTNIGHCEAAAGMASLIKMILCLQHSAIPPHLNLKSLNPRINLDRIPARIPMELTHWGAAKKIGAVSSFSMSATNVHVIVQEPPKPKPSLNLDSSNSQEMITFSAKSENALQNLIAKYVEFLKRNPQESLRNIAYCANMGRAHLTHRISVLASSTTQFCTKLEQNNFIQGKVPTTRPKIGFLFPGQGSQYVGMAKGLYDEFPAFRKAFDRCSQLFENSLHESLQNVMWEKEDLLNQTLYCQPAIFSIQYCLLQIWASLGVMPHCVLGHSVGEFAAAVSSGILSLEDGMKLVISRSQLVQKLATGSMLAVRAPKSSVEILIKKFVKNSPKCWIDIAAINSPEEVVVSGKVEVIQEFETFCVNNKVSTVKISATHAFHSAEMDVILEEFGTIAEKVEINDPVCTYVSGTLAQVMDSLEFDRQYWQRHLRDSVRFADAIQLVWSDCKLLVEIGPQPILLGLAMTNVTDASGSGIFCPSLRRNVDPVTSFYTAMQKLYAAGVDFDWKSVYSIQRKRVNLPLYPFQREKHWVDFQGSKNDESPIIHPFLGHQIQTPLDHIIFTQIYKLSQMDYLEDHKVADKVIVPAAGMLESFLAAGREVLQGGATNRFPITIQNLVVEAALPLDGKCRIQTLVRQKMQAGAGDPIEYEVSIHRKLENCIHKWRRHASAKFILCSELLTDDPFDLNAFKLTHAKESLTHYYKAIADNGIQLGSKFQSLLSVWYGQEDTLTHIAAPDDSQDYICHPIILDAMIQTFAFRKSGQEFKSLHLPVGIRKFTWLSKTISKDLYARVNLKTEIVTLYTDSGILLAVMVGIEMVETTVSSLTRALRADSHQVPDYMADIWMEVTGKTTARIDTSDLVLPGLSDSRIFTEIIQESENATKNFDSINTYPFYCFLDAIRTVCWPWPSVGDTLKQSDWKSLLTSSVNQRIIPLYFNELENRGYLAVLDKNTESYKVLRPMPSAAEVEMLLVANTDPFLVAERKLSDRFRFCLPQILNGRMKPLTFLFPENEPDQGAFDYYNQSLLYKQANKLICASFTETVSKLKSSDGIVRVLEIGAGSGSSTAFFLSSLQNLGIPFQYTFSDISTYFLKEAKQKFESNSENMSYQLLNIEEDPLSQGFCPHEFDVVIGVQVVHATKNIVESLRNVKKILKVGGVVILGEAFEPHAFILFLFGMTDGWWSFSDSRTNNSRLSALASEKQWTDYLKDAGFDSIGTNPGKFFGVLSARNAADEASSLQPSCSGKQWLVVSDEDRCQLSTSISSKLRDYDRRVISDESEGTNVEGVLYFCTESESMDIVTTQQRITSRLLKLLQWCEQYPTGHNSRPKVVVVTRGVYTIGEDSEPGNPNGATAWGIMKVFRNENTNFNISLMDLEQVPTPFEEDQILSQLWNSDDEFFTAFRGNSTFVLRLKYLEMASVEPISIPQTHRFKSINNTENLDQIQFGPAVKESLPAGHSVEIQVRARSLGLNVSGVVVSAGHEVTRFQVGDEVVGMTEETAGLRNHVVTSESRLMKLPKHMTFVEACTIPEAFLVAHKALLEIGRLTSTDRVLILDATSGVGLAAIQIARLAGAEIYVTAHTRRQQAYLRNLGIKHVLKAAPSISDGMLVLDSLKNTISRSYETPIAVCLKTSFCEKDLREIEKCFDDGTYKCVASASFPLFRLTDVSPDAGQIGETILQFPVFTPSKDGKFEQKHFLFNDKSSYLITGGLGGIGLEVTRWMLTMGAKTIVLMARSLPSLQILSMIDQWNRAGGHILIIQADVGDYESCKRVLEHIDQLQLPPLRGIMHAAGVLADRNIDKQTAKCIQYVLKPKVYGGWFLHNLTLNRHMEFFIMFSSISGLFALPGQCHHTAANRYLDALAHSRVSMGLPCSTINWGAWSDIGAAASVAATSETFVGFRIFTPAQGIAALEQIMSSRKVQVGVSEVSDWNVIDNILRQGKYLDLMRSKGSSNSTGLEKFDYMFNEVKTAESTEERLQILEDYVTAIIRQTLNIPQNEVLDVDQQLNELGVDSLMAIELKNKFQIILGDKPLRSSALQASRTIRSLSVLLTSVMEQEPVDPAELEQSRQDHFIF